VQETQETRSGIEPDRKKKHAPLFRCKKHEETLYQNLKKHEGMFAEGGHDTLRQILFPPPSLSSKNQTEKAAENWRCCVGLLLPPAATAAAHKR
jgi:hypothetical protein